MAKKKKKADAEKGVKKTRAKLKPKKKEDDPYQKNCPPASSTMGWILSFRDFL